MWIFVGFFVACSVSTERLDAIEARQDALERAHEEQLGQRLTELQALEQRVEAVERSAASPARPASETLSVPELRVVVKAANHVTVPRADVDLLGEEGLVRAVRVVPHKGPDGEVDGFRLSGIRGESVVSKLGFKNGDVVLSVNERPLTSMAEVMEAYQALRDEDTLTFEISRRGQRSSLRIDLLD